MTNKDDLNQQISLALRKLRGSGPEIYDEESGSLRQSHRIEGMFTTAGDRQGYRHVYCYMEKGLEEHEDLTAKILLEIIRFQLREGYSGSRIFLSSFGGQDDDLVNDPGALSIRSIDNSLPIARRLCRLARKDPIPDGKGAFLKIGHPTIDDLLVIFRSGSPIFMEKPLRNRYISRLKKHTFWVTIDHNQVTVEVGKIPNELNKPEMPELL